MKSMDHHESREDEVVGGCQSEASKAEQKLGVAGDGFMGQHDHIVDTPPFPVIPTERHYSSHPFVIMQHWGRPPMELAGAPVVIKYCMKDGWTMVIDYYELSGDKMVCSTISV